MEVNSRSILCLLAKEFDLKRDETKNRIRLQKMIYLLQTVFGMKLGYGFTWYKHGPYCQDLVFDAYAVLNSEKQKYKESTKGWDFSQSTKAELDRFRKTFADILNNPRELEIQASVDFFRRQTESKIKKDDFAEEFLAKKKNKTFDGKAILPKDIANALEKIEAWENAN